MHDEAGNCEGAGQGAGILSFRSQRKLRPVALSNTASDGKLGKRHPDSTPKRCIKDIWKDEVNTTNEYCKTTIKNWCP